MNCPYVTCIMLTADRPHFVPYAFECFLNQDYANAELLIFDTGKNPVIHVIPDHPNIHYHHFVGSLSLGAIRNLCCELAKGKIIIHLDDDDWYAQDWITQQVYALVTSGADISGLNNINFYSTIINEQWNYIDTQVKNPWVYGATMAYWKSFWKQHPFKEMNTGEDNDFIYNSNGKIHRHNYTEGYLGLIHNDNAGIRWCEDPREKLILEKWLRNIEGPYSVNQKKSITFNLALPLVTCIMPTANRRNFITSSIENFLKQDYPNKELVIIDDGDTSVADLVPTNPIIKYYYFEPKHTIGTKRNWACERASGEMITHWDDDDWYAEDWISHQVKAHIESGADISGINQIQFYSPSLNKYWMTKNSNSKRPWLTGQSLTYKKSFWKTHPFKDLQIGEDDDFVRNNGAAVFAHDYFQGFIATLHPHNTSMKFFEDPKDKISSK